MTTSALAVRAAANRRRAAMLTGAVAFSAALIGALIGYLTAGGLGAVIGLVVLCAAAASWMWWAGEVIAASRIKAVSLDAATVDPVVRARLLNLVEGLCATVGVRMPALLVHPSTGVNALCYGRGSKKATLVVTRGLLDQLNRMELEGVLAEELAKIKGLEILPDTITVASYGLLARAFQLPETETALDRAAAAVTRYPPGLFSAIEHMSTHGTAVHGISRVIAHLWMADPIPEGSAGRTSLEARASALVEL